MVGVAHLERGQSDRIDGGWAISGSAKGALGGWLAAGLECNAMADSGPMDTPCPFCSLPNDRIVDQSERTVVIRDAFPVSPGHTLVIPIRHVSSFFDLDAKEQGDLLRLLRRARARLVAEFCPDGFNIGINDGPAAGQTVPHMHLHLIPRRLRDVADPRGGVRWVVPGNARYWK